MNMDELYCEHVIRERLQHLIDAYYEGKNENNIIPFEITYEMLCELVESVVDNRISGIFDLSKYKVSEAGATLGFEDAKREEEFMIGYVNSLRARQKRPKRQHSFRSDANRYWIEWRAGKINYKNESEFINAMMDKSGIQRANTIREWIAEWKKEAGA